MIRKKYNVMVRREQIKSLQLLSFKRRKEKRREHSVTVKCYKSETETIFHTEEALITRTFCRSPECRSRKQRSLAQVELQGL